MRFLRRTWPYALFLVLIGVNVFVWLQREAIADWWRLRDYVPSPNIVALTAKTTMTERGRHLFYVNHPSLENKQDFNSHCADHSPETAVLGCYHGDRRGIYIFDVQDERLSGVEEVTAAHEMLHQAYDRLSEAERRRIDGLLEAYYRNGLQEGDVKTKLASYEKQTDVDLTNEMHSIFGSEVASLPEELEEYYAQYFSDRSKVVALSNLYQGEFSRRQQLIDQYDAELATLKKTIAANKEALEVKLAELDEKEKEVDTYLEARDRERYLQAVGSFNSTVQSYNTLASSTQRLIEQYNEIVATRNEIAVQEQELQKALDSSWDTPQQKQ